MPEDDQVTQKFELQKLQFEKSFQQRNFEIDNFWKRAWFFGALLLAIATAYFEAVKNEKQLAIYISFLGLLVSFFQGLMNRGSKYWQERWENKTKNFESALEIDVTKTKRYKEKEKYYLDAGILAKGENLFSRASRYSVSKLTILIWDIITLYWLMLWISNWGLNPQNAFFNCMIKYKIWLSHFLIIGYIIIFWFNGKVHQPLLKAKNLNPQRIIEPYFTHSEKYVKNSYELEDNDNEPS